MAELKNVAYCLGTRNCSIEIIDEERENVTLATALKTRIGGVDFSKNDATAHKQTSKIMAYFNGNNEPERPNLKWFAQRTCIC